MLWHNLSFINIIQSSVSPTSNFTKWSDVCMTLNLSSAKCFGVTGEMFCSVYVFQKYCQEAICSCNHALLSNIATHKEIQNLWKVVLILCQVSFFFFYNVTYPFTHDLMPFWTRHHVIVPDRTLKRILKYARNSPKSSHVSDRP